MPISPDVDPLGPPRVAHDANASARLIEQAGWRWRIECRAGRIIHRRSFRRPTSRMPSRGHALNPTGSISTAEKVLKVIEVHCRCEAIELRLTGEPVAQIYCHCDDCRAAQAAAYVSASVYPAPSVQVVRGQPTAMVVKATQRMRCAACGTYLFSDIVNAGMRSVNAFLLPPGEFKAQLHVQCQHAILPVVDTLPHYRGFPASFGGAEEFVAW